jgi:hypothetical protein
MSASGVCRVLLHGVRARPDGGFEMDVEWEARGVRYLDDGGERAWYLVVPDAERFPGPTIYRPELPRQLEIAGGFLMRNAYTVRHRLERGELVAFPIDCRLPVATE